MKAAFQIHAIQTSPENHMREEKEKKENGKGKNAKTTKLKKKLTKTTPYAGEKGDNQKT